MNIYQYQFEFSNYLNFMNDFNILLFHKSSINENCYYNKKIRYILNIIIIIDDNMKIL